MDLRELLLSLDPKSRDNLRRVLIRNHADRDAISPCRMWPCEFNASRRTGSDQLAR